MEIFVIIFCVFVGIPLIQAVINFRNELHPIKKAVSRWKKPLKKGFYQLHNAPAVMFDAVDIIHKRLENRVNVTKAIDSIPKFKAIVTKNMTEIMLDVMVAIAEQYDEISSRFCPHQSNKEEVAAVLLYDQNLFQEAFSMYFEIYTVYTATKDMKLFDCCSQTEFAEILKDISKNYNPS